MKEFYEEPTMEIVELTSSIITDSGFCQGETAIEGGCQIGG